MPRKKEEKKRSRWQTELAHLLHGGLYELHNVKTQKSLPYESQIQNGEVMILGARSKHAALFNVPIQNNGQLMNKLEV